MLLNNNNICTKLNSTKNIMRQTFLYSFIHKLSHKPEKNNNYFKYPSYCYLLDFNF